MTRGPLDPSRVLVTGAGGMVGGALKFGIKLTRAQLDVCDADAVIRAIDKHEVQAVLHLAALDIRRCESDPREAVRTNVQGTEHVVNACRAAGIPLTLLSTGAVFNGPPDTLHNETAVPDPQNLYGQTKQRAEELVSQLDAGLVVRTGWLFGADQAHHRRFVERAIELARRDAPITGTRDQQGSPTWIVDLADALERLVSHGARGVVHVANSGIASGLDLAREIVALLGSSSEVHAIRGAELPNPGPRRAASEALTTRGQALRPWQEALRAYVATNDAHLE